MQLDITRGRVPCYVDPKGMAVLKCPKCDTTRTIDTNDKNYYFKSFKAKCKCGASFSGQFEFRRFFRKKARLSGFYTQKKTGIRGYIVIRNISMGGLGFSCIFEHTIQKGDQLDITFTLDNPKKSKVTLWVEVLYINDRFIGVKRCDIDEMQPEIGFYLR